MSAVEQITAALDEAERLLEVVPENLRPGEWFTTESARIYSPAPESSEFKSLFLGSCDPLLSVADLIVSVVNRERAQIQHARDVLARHQPEEDVEVFCDTDEDLYPPGGGLDCTACNDGTGHMITACTSCLGYEGARYTFPCPEIASLLDVWCPEPTP